jgi:hypothetical protein
MKETGRSGLDEPDVSHVKLTSRHLFKTRKDKLLIALR